MNEIHRPNLMQGMITMNLRCQDGSGESESIASIYVQAEKQMCSQEPFFHLLFFCDDKHYGNRWPGSATGQIFAIMRRR